MFVSLTPWLNRWLNCITLPKNVLRPRVSVEKSLLSLVWKTVHPLPILPVWDPQLQHSWFDKRPVLPVEYVYRPWKVEDMCPDSPSPAQEPLSGDCVCFSKCVLERVNACAPAVCERPAGVQKLLCAYVWESKTVMHASSLFENLDPHFLDVEQSKLSLSVWRPMQPQKEMQDGTCQLHGTVQRNCFI